MRTVLVALNCALLLTACAPPAPPAAQPSADPAPAQASAALNPDAAALGPALSFGSWGGGNENGFASACYGAPQSECTLSVQCEIASGRITIMSGNELFPDQDTRLKLITQSATLDLPARSMNEGLPTVLADLTSNEGDHSALIASLSAPQDRFGVEVAGERQVYPWHEAIAAALRACAVR